MEDKRSINYVFLGIGYGGCRVASTFYKEYGYDAYAINTTDADLGKIPIPRNRKLLLKHSIGGAGKDIKVGERIFAHNKTEIRDFIKLHQIDLRPTAGPVRPRVRDAQDRESVTNIAYAAYEIAFAGHANDQVRSLLPDALARLLAPGDDRYLNAACPGQGTGLLELLLAQAARQEDENPPRREALWSQPHEGIVGANEGVRQSILVDRQHGAQPEDTALDNGEDPTGERRCARAARPTGEEHEGHQRERHAERAEQEGQRDEQRRRCRRMPLGKARRHHVPRHETRNHRDGNEPHDQGEEQALRRCRVGCGVAIPIAPFVAQFRAAFPI